CRDMRWPSSDDSLLSAQLVHPNRCSLESIDRRCCEPEPALNRTSKFACCQVRSRSSRSCHDAHSRWRRPARRKSLVMTSFSHVYPANLLARRMPLAKQNKYVSVISVHLWLRILPQLPEQN